MGDTFQGIMGNFNGYALENSDFNPQSDDRDVASFFNDDFGDQGEVIDRRTISKGRIKRIRKKKFKRFVKENNLGAFGGF